MNLRPATNDTSDAGGSFALVTYVPDPLRSFLTGLGLLLPGGSRPDAHITFLPPRTLPLPLELVCCEIETAIQSVRPFEIELGAVRVFPQTGMLYLSVEAGRNELHALHESLNRGNLFSKEHFEYIPHLTLGGPLSEDGDIATLRKVEQAWKNSVLPARFLVKEMVLLWQPGPCSENEWSRISAHCLAPVSSVATSQA
jgi:hypothetical protein